MSEKEERISVIVYEKDPCENCSGNPMTDCQVCEKDLRYDGGITRQEAINRIAKALYLFNREDEWYKEHADMYSKYMNKMAEAALDALLCK